MTRENKKRVQDGVVHIAYVTGHVACAVLSKADAVVHFNSFSDQSFIFLAVLIAILVMVFCKREVDEYPFLSQSFSVQTSSSNDQSLKNIILDFPPSKEAQPLEMPFKISKHSFICSFI